MFSGCPSHSHECDILRMPGVNIVKFGKKQNKKTTQQHLDLMKKLIRFWWSEITPQECQDSIVLALAQTSI